MADIGNPIQLFNLLTAADRVGPGEETLDR